MKYAFITVTLVAISVLAIIISTIGIRMSYGRTNLVSDGGPMSYNIKELSLRSLSHDTKQIGGIGSLYDKLPQILNVRGNLSNIITGSIVTRPPPSGPLVALGPTKPQNPVYLVSTLGTSTYYAYVGDFSKLYLNCPNEVAILIHGWSPNTLSKVKDFNRASMSIDANHYVIPTIGVLWPSDNTLSSSSSDSEKYLAWRTAKENALKTGPKLAQFLTDFKNHCNDTTLRIVAHSLGSRVVNSMLSSLDSNDRWRSSGYKIETIHFLGAGISSKIPDIHATGTYIQNYVENFYNLYSSDDHLLKDVYPLVESFDKALGQTGASTGIVKPVNYKDTNVTAEIPANNDADGDGMCDRPICDLTHIQKGQNHLGYWGFVDMRGRFIDDGAMNVVVDEWKVGPFKVDKTREIKPLGPIREARPLGPIH